MALFKKNVSCKASYCIVWHYRVHVAIWCTLPPPPLYWITDLETEIYTSKSREPNAKNPTGGNGRSWGNQPLLLSVIIALFVAVLLVPTCCVRTVLRVLMILQPGPGGSANCGDEPIESSNETASQALTAWSGSWTWKTKDIRFRAPWQFLPRTA